jgi:hypothetical protein
MIFTNRSSDAFGVGIIRHATSTPRNMIVDAGHPEGLAGDANDETPDNNDYLEFNNNLRYNPLLGLKDKFAGTDDVNSDSFDVNNATAIAFLPVHTLTPSTPEDAVITNADDQHDEAPRNGLQGDIVLGYSFVMGRNNPGRAVSQDPGHPDRILGTPAGSNIAIIRHSFKPAAFVQEQRQTASGQTINFSAPARDADGTFRGIYRDELLAVTRPLPYGVGAEEHNITLGLMRRIRENLRVALKYGFFDWDDQTSGGKNNYEAHLVYSSLQYRF